MTGSHKRMIGLPADAQVLSVELHSRSEAKPDSVVAVKNGDHEIGVPLLECVLAWHKAVTIVIKEKAPREPTPPPPSGMFCSRFELVLQLHIALTQIHPPHSLLCSLSL